MPAPYYISMIAQQNVKFKSYYCHFYAQENADFIHKALLFLRIYGIIHKKYSIEAR